MIRVTCPHCEYAQEFADDRAGLEVPCPWCGDLLAIGGPDAELVPEPGATGFASHLAGSLCATAAFLFALLAVVGLPVLDFGLGYRIGSTRPIEAFWPVLLVSYGFRLVADRLLGVEPDGGADQT